MAHGVTKDLGLVQGVVMRVTRLDGCGRPQFGDGGSVTSEGFVSVGVTANTTDVDEISVQNAKGKTVLYQGGRSNPSGFGLEITFARVDPELIAILTGQETVLDADGNVVGFTVDTAVDVSASGFALEVWSGAPSSDACADDEADGQFGYSLFPFVTGGTLGDFSIENDAVSFSVSGANTKDGNAWGKGPYNVVLNGTSGSKTAGPLISALTATTALAQILVEVSPPAAVVGARPLLRTTDPAVTTITATVTSKTAALSVTPTVTNGVGVWWDFGDGTWDYVTTGGGATSHTYASGTYTVQASTNGTWVSKTVTVA